jgi:hypothetical protein
VGSSKKRILLNIEADTLISYATGDKFWGQFSVDSTEIVSNERATMFKEQLKLKDDYKQMIQALVSSHESKHSKRAARPQVKDVVEDKGKGLVILLHGRFSFSEDAHSRQSLT